MTEFEREWNKVQKEVTETAHEKGFHDGEWCPVVHLALAAGEIHEAIEAYRSGNPKDKYCSEFNSLDVELADCIIRLMDISETMGLNLPRAILTKKEFNKGRPYKHGKQF